MYRPEPRPPQPAAHDGAGGLPCYMAGWFYRRIYADPRWAARLDCNLVVRALLLGQAGRLTRAYLNEIAPGARVWQAAHVYGNQVAQVARRIGPEGFFMLTDIMPVQAEHARKKLAPYAWARVECCDAARFAGPADFDVAGSFFLLHEVPDEKKRQIVDNLLARVAAGGKAVFIDYHRPAAWHPARPIFKIVNAALEPFAHALWQNPIRHYAARADDFAWTQRTFFGGLYQCAVARRKDEA